MMRSLFLFFFMCFTSLIYAQQTNCYQKLKTGKFYYEVNGERINITRTKNKQIESNVSGKSKLILKISWENDSTYTLTHIKDVNMPGCLTKGDWIKGHIIRCDGTSYRVRYYSNKCGNGEADFKVGE